MANDSNAEALHNVGKGPGQKATDGFVNQGTSPSAFVSMEQRKSGKVEGGNAASIREKQTSGNDF